MRDRIEGVVDGCLAGDLNGWLANLDDPTTCESVICKSATGARRVFKTFQLREDVCSALSLPGTFGFSIPVREVIDLGARISVYDRHGKPLSGGTDVRLDRGHGTAIPPRHLDPAHIFIHIPKTAGTSLRNRLANLLPYSETLLIYPNSGVGISVEKLWDMPSYQRRQFSLIIGHFLFGLHGDFPQPTKYIAFLREVGPRLRSNILHHATLGTVFVDNGEVVPPSVAINEGTEVEFDNVMTRSIAGISKADVPIGKMSVNELDVALRNIKEHFAFIGKFENIEHDCDTLTRLYGGCSAPLPISNKTVDRAVCYPDDELERIDWPALMERNRIDSLLYAYLDRENLFSRMLSPPSSPPAAHRARRRRGAGLIRPDQNPEPIGHDWNRRQSIDADRAMAIDRDAPPDDPAR